MLIFVLLVFLIVLVHPKTVYVMFFHDQAQRHLKEVLVKFGAEVSSWHILRNVINASFFFDSN